MRTLLLTAALTLAIDQGVKDLLRRTLGTRSVRLGSAATLRLVSARVWLARANREPRVVRMWLVWALAAGALSRLPDGSHPRVCLSACCSAARSVTRGRRPRADR